MPAIGEQSALFHAVGLPDANVIDGLRIGTIAQDCNGRIGYALEVLSANCLASPTGAKLVDSVSGGFVPYSVESHNPMTGGGAPVVTGLLASACTNQVVPDVTHAMLIMKTARFTSTTEALPRTYHDDREMTIVDAGQSADPAAW